MATKSIRKNEPLLKWVRAALFFALTGWVLQSMSFAPAAAGWGFAAAAGVVALFSPGIAVLIAIIAMGLPLMAADFIVGAAFLIIGFAAVQYLGQDNGRAFLVLVAAFACVVAGPTWAAIVIAGYLFGASEGAVAAILACLLVEAAGLVVGKQWIGIVWTGGSGTALIDFAKAPSNLLSFGWLSASLAALDPAAALGAITGAGSKTLLVVQPVVWAIAAAVPGLLRRHPAQSGPRLVSGLAASAAGVGTAAVGTAIALTVLGHAPAGWGSIGVATAGSLVVALAVAALWDTLFAPLPRRAIAPTRPGSMSAEDADVDELLRLIATAEDQLASKHTTQSVVMITDMKSFSKMTEEDGSVVSAKTIQRHRDLLLPVIQAHAGHGKSTGGDGLVASFDSARDALAAAADMQRTLREYNATHASERDIIVRVGIASGEVVLDKGGRPFIGTALNLAARIMNLADGGQVFVTNAVAGSAGEVEGTRTADHSEFALKNIAEPVRVIELLWAEDQEPMAPGTVHE